MLVFRNFHWKISKGSQESIELGAAVYVIAYPFNNVILRWNLTSVTHINLSFNPSEASKVDTLIIKQDRTMILVRARRAALIDPPPSDYRSNAHHTSWFINNARHAPSSGSIAIENIAYCHRRRVRRTVYKQRIIVLNLIV